MSSEMNQIVISKEQLESLGLKGSIYLFEYDFPSAYKNPATGEISERFSKEDAKFFRDLRAYLNYSLKFKLMAIKNLYSSWIIDEDKLDEAKALANEVINKLVAKKFTEEARKIKIIQIFTTKEAFDSYEERKEDFLIEFIEEHLTIVGKALKELRIQPAALWRAKKCVEIVNILKDSLQLKQRINEIEENLTLLDEQISELEIKLAEKRENQKQFSQNLVSN